MKIHHFIESSLHFFPTKKISKIFKRGFSKLAQLKLLFSVLLVTPQLALAWGGYDYENRTAIDIGEGNLVREGLAIQFYDNSADDFHTAKVVLMESVAGGTRITVEDLDAKKERIFIMQN